MQLLRIKLKKQYIFFYESDCHLKCKVLLFLQYKDCFRLWSFPSFSHNTILTWTFLSYQIGSSVKVDPELVIFPDADGKNNVLCIKLDWEGCFNAVVKYNGVPVSQGQFTVISLTCELLMFLSCPFSWLVTRQVQHKLMLIRMIKRHWTWFSMHPKTLEPASLWCRSTKLIEL